MTQWGFDAIKPVIEKSLTEHRSTGDKSLPVDLNPSDLQGQYELLSSMSNDHDAEYPGNESEHPTRKLSGGKIECYRTYQSKITESGTTKKKRHPPTSFGNRFVYFIVKNDIEYVNVLLRFHYDGVRFSVAGRGYKGPLPDLTEVGTEEALPQQATPKAIRNVGHITTVQPVDNMAEEETLFTTFKSRIGSGSLQWRSHSADGKNDIIVMNNYDIHGKILPNEFVHVFRDSRGPVMYNCTCTLYRNHQKCLHTRYMEEVLDTHINALFLGDLQHSKIYLHSLLQKSLDSKDIGAVLLSSDNAAVKRFSILFNYKCTFVDLAPDNFLTCTETYCQLKNLHKRKASTLLEGDGGSCVHLDVMKANHETWTMHITGENPPAKVKKVSSNITVCVKLYLERIVLPALKI